MLGETHFKVNQLPLYPLGRIAERVVELRMEGREIYDFSQLNPNLGPPAAAVEAMVAAALKPHNHRYSSSQGIKKLREEVANWYSRSFKVKLDAASDVVLTLGTKQGLSHLLFAILRSGDGVLVPSPSYPIHGASVVLAGGHLINFAMFSDEEIATGLPAVLTDKSEGFFSRLELALHHSFPKPTTLLLSFPHNPTGVVVDQSFFDRVVQFARKEGIIVLHDFAYAQLVYEGGTSPSILSSPGADDCCVEFTTLSKTANLPGWRVGFAAGNTKLIGALKQIKGYLDYGAFQPLQIAAIQVLTGFESVVQDNLGMYAERRTTILEGLKRVGFEFERPLGGLFVLARLGSKFNGVSGDDVAHQLMEKSGVIATPGSGFDPSFKNYLRLVYSETETRTREAMKQLATFVTGLCAVILVTINLAHAGNCLEGMRDARSTITGNLSTDKKIEVLTKAREQCPDSADIAYLLGLASMESGDQGKAEENIRAAIKVNPQASYYVALTDTLIRQGKFPEASEAVKSGLELDGASAELLNSSGILELKSGKLSAAEALFKRAVAIKPNFTEASFNLGLVLQQEGRFDEAAALYQQVTTVAPNLLEPRFNLANLHLQNDKLDQADRVLREIPPAGVEKKEYWLLKAALAEKRGQLEESKQSLDRVRTIAGDSVELSLAQARLIVVGGDVPKGVHELSQLRDANPNNADIRSTLGWALILEGKKELAKNELEEALRLEPANQAAKKNLQTLKTN